MKNIIYMILGPVFMALAVNLIFEPSQMVIGGVSGLAIIIKDVSKPYVDGGINIGFFNLIVNSILILIAIFVLGRKYVKRMLLSAIAFSIALFAIPIPEAITKDYFLCAVFGGVFTGIGLGMIFIADASTGGTDLTAAIIHKYFKNVEITKIVAFLDFIIVAGGFFVFGAIPTFYAIISIFISMKVADGMVAGFNYSRMVYIISDESDLIANRIMNEVDRGVTGVYIKGMYSNNNRNMLLCVVENRELVKINEISREIDPNSFIIVSHVLEVLGNGFIKSKQ